VEGKPQQQADSVQDKQNEEDACVVGWSQNEHGRMVVSVEGGTCVDRSLSVTHQNDGMLGMLVVWASMPNMGPPVETVQKMDTTTEWSMEGVEKEVQVEGEKESPNVAGVCYRWALKGWTEGSEGNGCQMNFGGVGRGPGWSVEEGGRMYLLDEQEGARRQGRYDVDPGRTAETPMVPTGKASGQGLDHAMGRSGWMQYD
jgi:hypothetical protein